MVQREQIQDHQEKSYSWAINLALSTILLYGCLCFKKNLSVNIYNEEDVEEMIVLIRDSFITAFVDLEKVLEKKVEEVDESWES